MIFELILLFILLVLSFFFSGSETAVTAASKPALFEKEKDGNISAARLNELRKQPEKLLGMLLFGNNVVNIAITAISTGILIHLFGEYGIIIATLGVSFIVLIFTEILPKNIALQNPTTFALRVSSVLYFLSKICSPVVITLNWIGLKTARLFGVKQKTKLISEQEVRTEIRGAIELQTGDRIMSREKHMLKSVLDLSEITVGDIMTHRSNMATLNVNTPTDEIIAFVNNAPYSRVPLWSGKRDNIVGILHIKSLLKTLNMCYQNHTTHVDLMDAATKPWFILESTSLLNQLHAFKQRREHFALVVDEYGTLQGLVTLEDLLEEIVGDIEDETDDTTSGFKIERMENGDIRLQGSTPIRDINRHLKWNLPDENAATLAGLIMYQTERIPQTGTKTDINGYTFTIVRKDRNRLSVIDVTPPKS